MRKCVVLILLVGYFSSISAQSKIHIDIDSLVRVNSSRKVVKPTEVKYIVEKNIDSLKILDLVFLDGVRNCVLLNSENNRRLFTVTFCNDNFNKIIFTEAEDYIIEDGRFKGFFVIDDVYFYVRTDYPEDMLSATLAFKRLFLERAIYVDNSNYVDLSCLRPHFDPASWVCLYKDGKFELVEKRVF